MCHPTTPQKRFNLYYLYCDDEDQNHMPEQRLAEMRKALLMVYQKKYGSE